MSTLTKYSSYYLHDHKRLTNRGKEYLYIQSIHKQAFNRAFPPFQESLSSTRREALLAGKKGSLHFEQTPFCNAIDLSIRIILAIFVHQTKHTFNGNS